MSKKIYATREKSVSEREHKHSELARKLAGECVVLLENDGALPLKGAGAVALFGNGARNTVKGGTGSGDVNVRDYVNIERGLEEAGFAITTKAWIDRNDELRTAAKEEYAAWVSKEAKARNREEAVIMMDYPFPEPTPAEVTEADLGPSDGNVAIYVVARNSGEGSDRKAEAGDYFLFDVEKRNLELLSKHYDKVIVVLNIGGVMDMTEILAMDGIKAVVLMSQLGNLGGNVLADVLLGKVTPSGHLADTWAKQYSDYPSSAEFSMNNGNVDDDYYRDGIYVGYRYFNSFGVETTYPFGYGLSYTDFAIKVCNAVQKAQDIAVTVEVTNVGKAYTGKQVVQVYASAPNGKLVHPFQELKAFVKTKELVPGESQQLEITLPLASLASYDENRFSWMVEAGDYVLRVGENSRDAKAAVTLKFADEVVTEVCKPVLPLDCAMEEIAPKNVRSTEATDITIVVDTTCMETKTNTYSGERQTMTTSCTEKLTMEDVVKGRCSVEDLVAQLTVEEMAELCVGTQRAGKDSVVGAASYNVPGAAGDTSSVVLDDRLVKNLILADGPAGLRLQPHFKTDADGNILPGGAVFGDSFVPFENVPEDAIDYYQYCTAIPIGWALAQSWNCELVEEIGCMIGAEMQEFGVDLWLAPALNIHRNPLCGRNFEYYSEDPFLAGKMAAAMTNGVQQVAGKGTTIKHFAANNQEENRYFTNAHVGERALREIYLKGFEIAVKESQPLSIMTSYNLLNGTHTANAYDLIQSVARDEWGFAGVVMTDWYTSQDIPAFTGKYAPKYPISGSCGCILAGNDLQMPGCQKNVDDIVRGVKEGALVDGYRITLADLQFCAWNLLRVVAKISKESE
ncbi:MAG: glycoside hydrolase family 3 C-terminal domain-containing protein [Lachnospiraceae bacterium]|nr:glycoside hydrolase family 3 C-terminal domain-containing protein [Lachnospiraceae bacterium]MBQ2318417.1 glycoside hydrolase family 3 C-terminal domain-containing protein [Lachnospiraceae bacterium]MBQ4372740.1 glycoside hydrolase family 3 C-terminal domain-containing protein [Lachnospiraceae bacterium]MBQ5385529.1 glycoside hydrolase family 3 C-terminal domain-containing protein [Lachnospiraceae bacterium]